MTMPLEPIRVRLTPNNRRKLDRMSKELKTSLGKSLNKLISEANIDTLTTALKKRFESNLEVESIVTETTLLVEPTSIKHLNNLALRTGLSVGFTIRLIIDARQSLIHMS